MAHEQSLILMPCQEPSGGLIVAQMKDSIRERHQAGATHTVMEAKKMKWYRQCNAIRTLG